MAASRTIILAFCNAIVLSILVRVEGQITVDPTSVAATTNEPDVTINCSARNIPPSNFITWSYTNIQGTWIEIFNAYRSNSTTTDPTNFAVSYYGGRDAQGFDYTAADLTINLAKQELAVIYDCRLSPESTITGSSSFLVLDPVECPVLDGMEYAAGNTVSMTCSVNYYQAAASQRPPILQIYNGNTGLAEQGGVPTQNNDTRMTYTLNKTLTIEDDEVEYICVVSFTSGVPEYNDNCSMVYFVLHEVTEISFYPPSNSENPTTVRVGDPINCTANGRPSPTIAWYDNQDNMLMEGAELTVTEDMKFWDQPVSLTCRANNSIDGGLTYTTFDANYTLIVEEAMPVVQSAGTEAWIIAVAVIVPIVVLTAIGIAIFFFIRHRKKKKATKQKTTNGSTVHHTTAATTTTTTNGSYSPVATGDMPVSYSSPSRPPPTSAPRTNASISLGPPGPDNRNGNGAVRGGNSPGFGDLGVQPYGGSSQAVNYQPRSSLHGSNQALGMGGVSMNPNPGYQMRASNPVLNASVASSARPQYPYNGSNSALNASVSMNPSHAVAAVPGVGYGRQPSIASSSGRSHASSYNAAIPAMGVNRYPNDLSSMHGSEV